MTRLSPAVSLGVGALLVSSCGVNFDRQAYIEHEEKRFEVQAPVELNLYTFDGSMEIRSWDRPEVVVDVEKRGPNKDAIAKIDVIADRKGNRIQVEARNPGGGSLLHIGHFTSITTKFIVNVPRKTSLVVHTEDGAIVVERVDGRIELRSGDGRITVSETSGDLFAESRDGSIQLDDVGGRVDARTGDGSVRISGAPAVLRARTGDGSIVLRLRRGTVMAEDWLVTTGDGSISAELPDDFSADIEADPGSDGRARSELTLVNMTGGTRDQRVLRGRLGQGGRAFVLRTGDGTIRLTKY